MNNSVLLLSEKHPKASISLIEADITTISVDAIINSANETLLGDDGVDGAIHIAAGPKLREYCAKLGGCKVGEAKTTPSYNLPCKMIIHTVGPQYGNEDGEEEALLRKCYGNCLSLADENQVKTIALPSISTGQYGYPIEEASRVALSEIEKYLQTQNTNLEEVIIVLYSDGIFNDNDLNNFNEYIKTAKKLGLLEDYDGKFYDHTYRYLDIDDKKYWTMDEDVEKTELINR